VSDTSKTRRRLIFSTSFREPVSTPLHARIPLAAVARSTWTNLVLDLDEMVAYNFGGAKYARLELITLGAACRLRKIVTLREAPLEATAHSHAALLEPLAVPKALEFPPNTEHLTQLLNMPAVLGALSAETAERPSARPELASIALADVPSAELDRHAGSIPNSPALGGSPGLPATPGAHLPAELMPLGRRAHAGGRPPSCLGSPAVCASPGPLSGRAAHAVPDRRAVSVQQNSRRTPVAARIRANTAQGDEGKKTSPLMMPTPGACRADAARAADCWISRGKEGWVGPGSPASPAC